MRRITTIAAAAMMTVQSVGAAAAPAIGGLSSNRAALGLPVAATDNCTTVGGRASCVAGEQSQLAGASPAFFIVIFALAAIAVGIGVSSGDNGGNNNGSPNSP